MGVIERWSEDCRIGKIEARRTLEDEERRRCKKGRKNRRTRR